MKNGVYAWAEEKLYPAHKSCQAKCRNGMKRGVGTILIDNTNMRKKEMIPYVELAHEFGYFVTIREPQTPWRNNVDELAMRNEHGLDRERLKKQKTNFEKTTAAELWKIVVGKSKEQNNNGKPEHKPKAEINAKQENKPKPENKQKPKTTAKMTECDAAQLKTNREKIDALCHIYNMTGAFDITDSLCILTLRYPPENPIFDRSFKGNSIENACGNALAAIRPMLFRPKNKWTLCD